ncbi:hypothetical protein CJU89_5174 [Yarrowia sp. B02]|nr:hypothetical protein CJU89_5174 [Yarrowia sp. B02]
MDFSSLPLEIANVIFALCHLETCVDLRQVNSFWNNVFRQADQIVQSKLQQRNPVIQPGESGSELSSWTDCAIVFVSRLRNAKWTHIESFEEVEAPPGKKTQVQILKARQVYGRLPSDFRGLLVECDRSKLNEELILKDKYAIDGRTLRAREIIPERDEMGKVVSADADKAEITYKGVSVVLPAKFAELTNIYMNDAVIVARSGSECYLLPRDSTDFREGQGFGYSQQYYESPEFSNRSSYISSFYGETSETPRTFRLADLYQKRMVDLFATSQNIDAVATFNGLVWFTKCTGKGLAYVPVLLDEGKMYYRKDKMVHGIDGRFWGDQGSKSRDAQRFTCYGTETGAEVIDLINGTVTDIETDSEASHIFTGFSNGEFGAWYFSPKMMDGLNKMLRAHLKVYPGREEYDLAKKPEKERWWKTMKLTMRRSGVS